MGAILSIFLVFATLVYAYTRLIILLELSDTTYKTIEETRVDKLEYFRQIDSKVNVAFNVAHG